MCIYSVFVVATWSDFKFIVLLSDILYVQIHVYSLCMYVSVKLFSSAVSKCCISTMCVCSYFKINDYYGLSCYEKISVSSVQERGARMKSVGVLARTYRYLHIHREFLQRQVRYIDI